MTKYQLPENLIDRVQILLRKEALFESFNPNDPSIPPPPTLQDIIAGIGNPGEQLRCKHCRGELLRGAESIICVYCGQRQEQVSSPQPIAYKSTLGFGYLMQSLRVDGSEIVELPIGGTQSNEGRRSSLKNEIALSDLLNLELKWPDESKRFGMINKAQLPGERSFTLLGVDLNELFSEGSTNNASCVYSEQAGTSKKIEIKEIATFPEQRSLNLFEDPHSLESTLRSNEGANDESFSGWEAEFQSSVPNTGHEQLQSFEAVKSLPADNASQADSVQGHVGVEKSANVSSSSYGQPINDLTNDKLDVKFSPKKSEGNILVGKVLESADASSSFNWSLDDQQKTAIADPSHVETRTVDDSFNHQSDARTLTDTGNNHYEPSTATLSGTSGLDISDGWSDFTGSVGAKSSQPKANILGGPDDDSLDGWNDFTVSSSAVDSELKTRSSDLCLQEKQHSIGDPMLGGNDFAILNEDQQVQQHIRTDTSQDKTFGQDDSIGLFTGVSLPIQDDRSIGSGTKLPDIGITKEADDSFNLWNDFKSSSVENTQVDSIKGADEKLSGKGDKTMGVWDDFASLGASKNEQKICEEKVPESSVASWNDNSFNSWNDLTESTGLSDGKPISNDISYGEWKDFSSSHVTNAGEHQSSGEKADESQTVLEVDDLFSSWSNLRSSGGTQSENSFPSVTESSQDQIRTGKASETPQLVKENSAFDSWGDFGHSILMPEKQSQAGRIEISENKPTADENDLFSRWSESGKQSTNLPDDQLKSNGVLAQDGNLIGENDDSFDAWTDFTSSSNVPINQSPSSSVHVSVGEEAVKHNDMFDSWDVFSSSSDAQAGNNPMVPRESMPDINLFSMITNSQGVERNSFSQPDVLPGVFGNQSGSSEVAVSPPKVSDLVRMENDGDRGSGNSEQFKQTESTHRGTSDLTSSDVENLFTEMHDLSFMLENNLSIPKMR